MAINSRYSSKKAIYVSIHVKTSKDVFPACIFLYFVMQQRNTMNVKTMKVNRYRRFIRVKRNNLKVN